MQDNIEKINSVTKIDQPKYEIVATKLKNMNNNEKFKDNKKNSIPEDTLRTEKEIDDDIELMKADGLIPEKNDYNKEAVAFKPDEVDYIKAEHFSLEHSGKLEDDMDLANRLKFIRKTDFIETFVVAMIPTKNTQKKEEYAYTVYDDISIRMPNRENLYRILRTLLIDTPYNKQITDQNPMALKFANLNFELSYRMNLDTNTLHVKVENYKHDPELSIAHINKMIDTVVAEYIESSNHNIEYVATQHLSE